MTRVSTITSRKTLTSAVVDEEDQILVEELLLHSQAALQKLYDRFGPLVYGITLKFLEDAREAEETTQDVFVKVWRTIAKFDSRRSSLKGWICVVTRSACLDRLRKRHTRPDHIHSNTLEFESMKNLGDESNIKILDTRDSLRESLKQLKSEYRDSLELFYFKGYTQKEIAEILELPVGSVKSYLRRGLVKLRNVFERQ